jgi:threonine/homoserine/homoserine lactone efflux protein
MNTANGLVGNALVSGTVAGITTALAASLAGKREAGSYAAPLNATSHIVWGDREASAQNGASAKYTLTGFLLNHAATIFWAGVYEQLFGRKQGMPELPLKPVVGAAVVAAGAYVTDYYLVPKRLTPGYELRLSNRSLGLIFGALAVGLIAGHLLNENR